MGRKGSTTATCGSFSGCRQMLTIKRRFHFPIEIGPIKRTAWCFSTLLWCPSFSNGYFWIIPYCSSSDTILTWHHQHDHHGARSVCRFWTRGRAQVRWKMNQKKVPNYWGIKPGSVCFCDFLRIVFPSWMVSDCKGISSHLWQVGTLPSVWGSSCYSYRLWCPLAVRAVAPLSRPKTPPNSTTAEEQISSPQWAWGDAHEQPRWSLGKKVRSHWTSFRGPAPTENQRPDKVGLVHLAKG